MPRLSTIVCSAAFAGLLAATPANAQVRPDALAPNAKAKGANEHALGTGIEALTTVRVASGLSRPVFVTNAPGDYTRLFIVEQHTGDIEILNLKTGVKNGTPFLNLPFSVSQGNEQGLLGLAFHPDYQNNGYFYINYTTSGGTTTIARYERSTSDLANNSSGTTLLTISQPFTNHNGGWIGFSPFDGTNLYIGTGDGGSANDPGNRAQDITNQKLGKMLRIDVDGTNGPGGNYGIPADNPFVGVTGDDEIWAYGLRNPWRNGFDRLTGDLYIGDVGQNAREEIDFQPASSTGGENYGWRCMEGNACTGLSGCTCNAASLVDPIREYTHGGSPFRCSITGGSVYRGCAIPSLDGTYFFADFCSNQIWSFEYDGASTANFADRTSELDPPGILSITSVSSFGEDQRGEMYVVELGGEVFQIVPVTPTISEYDIDCSGSVGFTDLNILLGEWGPCDGCISDFNGDGSIGFTDLNLLLADWG